VMLLIDEGISKPHQPLVKAVNPTSVAVGDPLRLQFLFELSRTLLNAKEAKPFPDLITFAYFCREKAVQAKLKCFPTLENKRGWGVLIHIAPANVPINFAFSLLFGFVSGNSNILRLPTKSWPQVHLLIEFISELLNKPEYSAIKKTILFVRTKHDSSWLREGIGQCDGLLVWGGDNTVAHFRSLPKSPRCVEMYFPNRVSSLLIDAASFLATSVDQKKRVLKGFYYDTYVVDQNACSSPSRVLWVGIDSEISLAKHQFWGMAKEVMVARSYTLDPVARIDRYLDVMANLKNYSSKTVINQLSPDLWTQEAQDMLPISGRYGNFSQTSYSSFNAAIENLRSGEQTLTYFGVSPQQICASLEVYGNTVDRVVPIGQALNMNFIWDGVNLLEKFSRYVEIK